MDPLIIFALLVGVPPLLTVGLVRFRRRTERLRSARSSTTEALFRRVRWVIKSLYMIAPLVLFVRVLVIGARLFEIVDDQSVSASEGAELLAVGISEVMKDMALSVVMFGFLLLIGETVRTLSSYLCLRPECSATNTTVSKVV